MAILPRAHRRRMRSFIAVGAGHIGGKGGLLEILAARGYALRQVHDAND